MTTEQRRPRARRTDAVPATAEEVFLSHSMGEEKIISRMDMADGSSVTFDIKTATKRVLYRPTTWGWESAVVPSSNVVFLLQSGMKTQCGDCGGNCSPDPMTPTPNACPGREKFATSRCPGCRKVFYDFDSRVVEEHMNALVPQDEDEGTMINQEAYRGATPELRLKADSDQHIIAFHPTLAFRLGLISLSDLSQRRG